MIFQSARPANRSKNRRVRRNFVGRILGLVPLARIQLNRGYTWRNFQPIILNGAIFEANLVDLLMLLKRPEDNPRDLRMLSSLEPDVLIAKLKPKREPEKEEKRYSQNPEYSLSRCVKLERWHLLMYSLV